MNEAIDFLTSNTTLAYMTAFVIFVITVILLIKRLIGFMVSLLLLVFALISGLAIANHDLFREILQSFKYSPETTQEDQYSHFKNKLGHALQELKEEYIEKKDKLEALYNDYQSKQTTSDKKTPVEEKTTDKPKNN